MRNYLIVATAVLASVSVAFAQRVSGELRLRVTDPAGARVHAAGVIVGRSVGVERTFETDDEGNAILRGLPLAQYELTVRSNGLTGHTVLIDVLSQIPIEREVRLDVTPVSTELAVTSEPILDPVQTAQYLPRQMLDDHPSAAANRSVIGLVNTQPGWLLEANGVLHPRGSEYDVQYVVDGVPLYDNRSPAFAQSIDVDEVDSLNVRTSGYPAEFGLKLGGVVETAGRQNVKAGLHGAVGFQNGSFDNQAGSLSVQYGRGASSFAVTADAMGTHRYLDPPVEENFTNHGTERGLAGTFERQWSAADHTRIYFDSRLTKFMVPNELLQQDAAQRQDRDGGETLGQISHTHIFSAEVLGQFRVMSRDTHARLWSNPLSTPIQPAQDRGFRETYAAASAAAHYGSHELKGGVETWFSSVREDLSYHISAYRLGAVRIFDRDVPPDFQFSARAPGRTQSGFIQDSWRISNLSVSAGVRFDHYRLIADETAWSPRLGIAYEAPRTGFVLRGAYDRAFQIPAIENVLLASSDQVANLGGEGAFIPLESSRADFFEAGFSKTVSRLVQISGNWYRRQFSNFADDDLLFNTGVSFPIAFSKANVHGFEAKIDLRRQGPFTGQLSYSNMKGTATLPVAGGLFLGDEAADLLTSDESFPISQDQRNTVRSQLRFQPRSRWWLAVAASYNSGLPFETEGATDEAFVRQQYGDRILERVNVERGRVRPSSSIDASAGAELLRADRLKVRLQADVFNLANRLNLINFAGVFSGTALDAPRSFSVRLRGEF